MMLDVEHVFMKMTQAISVRHMQLKELPYLRYFLKVIFQNTTHIMGSFKIYSQAK